jgi:hypothetical protein
MLAGRSWVGEQCINHGGPDGGEIGGSAWVGVSFRAAGPDHRLGGRSDRFDGGSGLSGADGAQRCVLLVPWDGSIGAELRIGVVDRAGGGFEGGEGEGLDEGHVIDSIELWFFTNAGYATFAGFPQYPVTKNSLQNTIMILVKTYMAQPAILAIPHFCLLSKSI